MNEYPRETLELAWVAVTARRTGAPVTSGIKLAITPLDERPSGWTEPSVEGDLVGIMIDHLEPGYYKVWAQVSEPPEAPALECGVFLIT